MCAPVWKKFERNRDLFASANTYNLRIGITLMIQAVNDEPTETLMKRYLLGAVTEEQQAQIEEQCLADHAFYQLMRAVEDRLIDDYVYDQLNPPQRRQFEERFLTTPALNERVEFAKALQQSVAGYAVNQEVSLWQTLKRNYFGNVPALRVALGISAACLLVTLAGLLYALRQTRETTAQTNASQQRERELQARLEQQQQTNAELNHQLQLQEQELKQLKSATPLPTLAARVLTFGLSLGARGTDTTTIVLPAKTVSVRLVLPVALDATSTSQSLTLRARLLTATGDEIWVEDKLRLTASSQPKTLTLTLPAKVFASQDYLVRLSQVRPDGSSKDVGDYYFAVKRP